MDVKKVVINFIHLFSTDYRTFYFIKIKVAIIYDFIMIVNFIVGEHYTVTFAVYVRYVVCTFASLFSEFN